jgi:hypothetical protein
MRRAVIRRRALTPSTQAVESYLPGNYEVTSVTDDEITVEGTDCAGWTLDEYVIPRLATGLITAKEARDAVRYSIELDENPPDPSAPWKVTMPGRAWHTGSQYDGVRQLRVAMEQHEYAEQQERNAELARRFAENARRTS